MAVIVLAVSVLALFQPKTCLWVQTGWVNYLLMIVMFGMGLTLKAEDFAIVFSRPGDVIIGCMAQYLIMPALAFGLGTIFGLSKELLVGVILVGTCPGGTSSNVITFLSNGDTALSVGMTSVSTLLAPLLTPFFTYLYLRTSVAVDVKAMLLSIVQVVLIPIILGMLVNQFFGRSTSRVKAVLPVVSITAICLIIAAVVSHNSERIMTTGLVILIVVILHNLLGYLLGVILIPKYISQQNMLKVVTSIILVLSVLVMLLPARQAVWCLVLMGIPNSVVYAGIWPLAIHDLGKWTNLGSAIMVMALCGSAIFPLIYAGIADASASLHTAYWILIPAAAYMIFYAFAGYRINNWSGK